MDSISIRERSSIMDINKNGFLFLGAKMNNSSKYKWGTFIWIELHNYDYFSIQKKRKIIFPLFLINDKTRDMCKDLNELYNTIKNETIANKIWLKMSIFSFCIIYHILVAVK